MFSASRGDDDDCRWLSCPVNRRWPERWRNLFFPNTNSQAHFSSPSPLGFLVWIIPFGIYRDKPTKRQGRKEKRVRSLLLTLLLGACLPVLCLVTSYSLLFLLYISQWYIRVVSVCEAVVPQLCELSCSFRNSGSAYSREGAVCFGCVLTSNRDVYRKTFVVFASVYSDVGEA